ncbi:MAG: glycosyltransferase family 4 protein [Gaiellaceae bacterium]
MKVVVLTTSYPRDASDAAGRFVANAVESARRLGVDVDVVSPASFRHFGIAYGAGVVQNLRHSPWKLALTPAFLASYARAARAAAADADLVHAHWLPSALVARLTGKPYVLQLWGTDVEVARRAPALWRPLVRGAAAVVAASENLADAAHALGARRVDVVPSGVDVPDVAVAPEDPPHVLFVGRLSREKGILEFLEATEGLPRVIVGDGPLRDVVPDATGFVPPAEIGAVYDRAAVVAVPSRREGYGMTAREAMAHGRAVIATQVGGLRDAIRDGETGLFVPPGDPAALRAAIERLLEDPELRDRLGAAAREDARARFSRESEGEALTRLWERARLYRPSR